MGKLRTTYYNCNMSTSLLATFSTCLFLGGATEFVFWWKKLTSHWVEAAQCVQVSRWGSCCLLKELQIKLDITPKNKTRVRVRAGSASGRNCITPQPERRHKGNSPCPCTKSQQSIKRIPLQKYSQSTTRVKINVAHAPHCSQSNTTMLFPLRTVSILA